VLNERSRELLAANGWVVYLETSTVQQAERAARNRQRPLLHGHDPQQRLSELMKVREPLYRSIADFTVATDHQRVSLVAESIAAAYQRAHAAVSPPAAHQSTDA
jgi:shikimate kinase